MWTAPPMGTGHLIRLGEKDCVLRKGDFFIFELKPSEFKPEFSEQILGAGRPFATLKDLSLLGIRGG